MTKRFVHVPKTQLLGRDLRPKKSFGQNFLGDPHHIDRIADAIKRHAPADGRCVEFGAGTGALTVALLERDLMVHAVERDRDMVPILRDRFADDIESGRLVLHEANAKTFAVPFTEPYVLCGNLPYHLTSQLLRGACAGVAQLSGAVFLIQNEVADRVSAGPGSKTYGSLSVLVQSHFEVTKVHVVPAGAFWPPPEVDGGVIGMAPRERPVAPLDAMERVLRTAFAARRKTLRNTMKPLFNVAELEALDIDPRLRPETLTVDDFGRMANAFALRSPEDQAPRGGTRTPRGGAKTRTARDERDA